MATLDDGQVFNALDECVPMTLDALTELVAELWADVVVLANRVRSLEQAAGDEG